MRLRFNDSKFWNHLEEMVCATLLGIMLVMLFLQVVFRYFLGMTTPIMEEYSLYMFIWFVFLASSNAFLRDDHIKIEAFCNRLPGKGKAVLNILVLVLNIVFSLVVGYEGFIKTIDQLSLGSTSATMFPLWVMSLALPVGMLTAVIRSVQIILGIVKNDLCQKQKGVK